MAGGKETPRQKMIGMMYLVLTALLALNVSKEILNAFILINEGLEQTNTNFEEKTEATMAEFELAHSQNPEKVKEWLEKAQSVSEMADELEHWLTDCKGYLISCVDGVPRDQLIAPDENGKDTLITMHVVNGKGNYDIPTEKMIGSDPTNPRTEGDAGAASQWGYTETDFTAIRVKERMVEFRDLCLSMIGDDPNYDGVRKPIQDAFKFEGSHEHGVEVTWEIANFDHVILAAAITNITKLQADIRNAEGDVLNFLLTKIDAADVKVNKIEAIAVYDSYILQNDSKAAKIFLAAYDSTQVPKIEIGDSTGGGLMPVEVRDGAGYFGLSSSSVGAFSYSGALKIMNKGIELSYPFSITYNVIQPSATVSADKMNVFYIGPDNPVHVSAAGVPPDAVSVSISGGGNTISKSGDGWNVKVKSGPTCTVSVSAKMPDGSTVALGKQEFRVKSLPDPVLYFSGKSSKDTKITVGDLRAGNAVAARLDDSDFDAPFSVVSFEMTVYIGGAPASFTASGGTLTSEMKSTLTKVKPGQRVYFESVKVKGPDGRTRSIPGLSFKII